MSSKKPTNVPPAAKNAPKGAQTDAKKDAPPANNSAPMSAHEMIAALKEAPEADQDANAGGTWSVRRPKGTGRVLLLCIYPDHAIRVRNEVRASQTDGKGVTRRAVVQQGVDLKFVNHHVWINPSAELDEVTKESMLEKVVRLPGYGSDFIVALDLLVGLSGRAPTNLPAGIVIGRNSAKGFVKELIRRSWFKNQIESDDFAMELRGVVKNDGALLKRVYSAKATFQDMSRRNRPIEVDE